ncbi:U-box domain-containing protein 3-like [Quercus robur]|uniref:U-box domain-containing protein 3-like n=1 Tax=Quercus robur TaxID=38942 RepID=UPI00216233D1|nr:U-box domain-containing protein 3-like [Quercus robur]
MEEMVVGNLFNGERDAQIQAARELSKLSSKQRHKLAERGVMSPLIVMLHSQDYEAIEAALFALLSLAFGSERNKIRIVKSGAIPVLLNLLQCQNEALIELTLAAMLILSSCTANKLKIASSGTIQHLVEFLNGDYSGDNSMNSISMQAKLDSIATLHNLSTCQQIIPSIASSGLLYSLLQLIHNSEKSSELVEKTIGLLENIVSFSENALCETASADGVIHALVETIEDGSPQCKEHAVGILLLICQSSRERYRGLILREGVMPGLLQLSVDGTRRAKNVSRELLLLLRDCSSYGSRNKQSKHELVEQIMQEIDAGDNIEGTTLRLVEEMIAKLST